MVIYGLKSCATCRKAREVLPAAAFRDIRESAVPGDVLTAAWARFGAAPINTRSATWRGFDAAARARVPRDLPAEHPALMKRPLIVRDGALFLGWGVVIGADPDRGGALIRGGTGR